MNKVLVFDVWGDYAHFRRFYTTTSPLSFPIPPRTALCGLIGAIVGLQKEANDYLNYFSFNTTCIALKLLNPIKKAVIAENLIHTKNAKGPGMNLITERTRIRFEFLKDQKYRLYFHSPDEGNIIYKKLKQNLEQHKTVFTPSLGLSENIANYNYEGEFEFNEYYCREEYIYIDSVMPLERVSEKEGIEFEQEGEYFSIRMPLELNTDRIVTKYGDIIFDRNCRPIKSKIKGSYISIDYPGERKENIVFME